MPRTNLSRKFPAPTSQQEDVPEIQEVEEIRVRIPGTVFEMDENGYVRVPAEMLQRMLDNRS